MAARRSRQSNTQSKAQTEFVSEAEDLLNSMAEDCSLLLDPGSRASGDVDPERINRFFRSAHTLKGLAAMFGFSGIGDLAHQVEDLLDSLRMGRIEIRSPAVELLEQAIPLFSTLLQHAGDEGFKEEAGQRVEEMTSAIAAALTAADDSEADELTNLALDPQLLHALTEYEEHRLRESLRLGRHVGTVETSFEIACFEEGLGALSQALREVAEIVSTLPSPGDEPGTDIRFTLLVASELSLESLASRIDAPNAEFCAIASAPEAVEPVVEACAGPERSSTAPSFDAESLQSISETVRVDIRKLDELMMLVGELVIQRGAISDLAARLSAQAETRRLGADLAKIHKVFDRKLRELQTSVLDVRMVPLRQVFEKLTRVVRRLRRDTGKQVQIEFEGADTELDKLIVEELVDPLMHLVRNAFDHAIESAEERRALGKPETGTVRVSASQRGNHVVIEVGDDGRGVDTQVVRARAQLLGLVSPDANLSQRETLNLVFSPGFSTRDEVGETSGRGVGMDVVRTNLAALGGAVELQSQLGCGATITLTLPITLAIIQALLVRAAGHRFAIPLNSVLETLMITPEEIQRSEGREFLNLRGHALLLRRLSDELELTGTGTPRKLYVVVLGLGELRLGLVVDGVEGQQDTVLKPIQGPVTRVRGIAGATELGDEGTVLVLDVSSLVEGSVRRREAA